MPTAISVGNVRVTALTAGSSHLPPMFYPGWDASAHPELIQDDGTYHIPTGCFLIQGDSFTILLDAGSGPDNLDFPPEMARLAQLSAPPKYLSVGGLLPAALAAAGVTPAEITTVFLTHLHYDHIGWVAPGGTLFFPAAEVVYGAADWDALIAPAPADDQGRVGMEAAKAAGSLRPVDAPTVQIAPGITAHHAPGHTPGHYILKIASEGQEAYLLGDAVQHPLQLTDPGITFLSDADAQRASQTRQKIFTELEGRDVAIGMDHFPGLEFQHITAGTPRSWTTCTGPSRTRTIPRRPGSPGSPGC
ncbi:metallo-beta-lactamase superfamily protein [Streptomyces sp. Ag109_O5-1]|uniref:MBL fold metallo-hydrolase n=1 Tax=Streptomyces sp. Ag109_O5-1 TaxID=1938851 RepID=UPI000F4ECDD7|nr:MBL fold metallo-hydrolase [Streptomyces sp. Ag109_O5-1]RPE40716.1 metallo-beta-lactamase superfamily protein [Streptomyces sp. Ag109_O5-1]